MSSRDMPLTLMGRHGGRHKAEIKGDVRWRFVALTSTMLSHKLSDTFHVVFNLLLFHAVRPLSHSAQ